MKKSHSSRMRPMDRFLYLLTMEAMISVPPVLPLAEKTRPKPDPQKEAPIRMAMKGSLGNRSYPCSNHSKKEKEADREITPTIVLIRYFRPKTFNASNSRPALMMK